MKDSTSDLNVHEHEEWGDCSDPQSRRGNLTESELKYIKSYSPCSLLEELSSTEKKVESLPAVMITVGLDDSRVYPGESMRWMSILRQIGDRNQLKRLFILRLQKCVGHDGSVHLEDQINDSVLEICFLNEVVSVSTPTDSKYH
jgi:protease II